MVKLRAAITATHQQLAILESLRETPAPWGGDIPSSVATTSAPLHPPPPAQPTYAAPQEYAALDYGDPPAYPVLLPALEPSAEGGYG